MADDFNLSAPSTALLLMDFQNGIVANYGGEESPALSNAARLLHAARERDMLVVFVTVGFREGYPEIADSNRIFSGIRETGRFLESGDDTNVHQMLSPRPEEPRVVKRRVGALTGTDLDLVLRARGIDTLVLSGIATSGVVLSTLRVAADLDYRCLVVADACADGDDGVHDCLMRKVFPKQAQVLDTEAMLKMI